MLTVRQQCNLAPVHGPSTTKGAANKNKGQGRPLWLRRALLCVVPAA